MAKTPKKEPVPNAVDEVNAIIRLIDHCKRQGVAYFEGLNGIKFGIRAEKPAAPKVPGFKDDDHGMIP